MSVDYPDEPDEMPDEAAQMLAQEAQYAGQLANGSSAHTLAEQARAHSSSPRRIPLFERASARWWNPQFASTTLETQYWKCSFPLLRDKFRSGLIYVILTCILWMLYLFIFQKAFLHHWVASLVLIAFCLLMFWFTSWSVHYQRFYMPTSFLCTFLICLVSLLIFSSTNSFMGPVASLTTSIQVVLLIYTVIPLPLYVCILIGVVYSCLFELLSGSRVDSHYVRPFTKLALHACIHLLGVHLFILTQVRQRKTFLKVGQSLLARKDLELETQFKDHMIQSVMPKKVADELFKQTSELRRPSTSLESNCRTSNATTAGRSSGAESTVGILQPQQQQATNGGNGSLTIHTAPNVRKFRPFTMSLMTNVSILFADIAGFTRMSSNKSAEELVSLLNDLFGRFDYLTTRCNLEKISTLGDCYYCVAGCPEPREDHAKCCVEMGLAMIIAIRQFDMDRGQAVNMRVGIHTGKVMCGMVGTKRFKFDVFSNDVDLANEMESTGIAGRVHISEVTKSFLDNQYILEDGPEHKGMKTYFIAGRSKEFESISNQFVNVSDSESSREHTSVDVHSASANQQMSFRKKLAGKLRTFHSTSLPMSRATTNSIGGGSLRMKLLDRSKANQASSAQVLNQTSHHQVVQRAATLKYQSQSMSVIPPHTNARKSSSLQALTQNNQNSQNSTNQNSVAKSGPASHADEQKMWETAARIGGKISMELANGSSANNSARGSRSSGLQDAGSDLHSVGGLDTAISHHHNAASLTRFDTENRDFDLRLAQIIQTSDGTFARGFWKHQNALNLWTLKFNEKDLEVEYRAHFAESSEKHSVPKTGLAKHLQLEKPRSKEELQKGPRYRYSGVFIDILVSAIFFIVPAIIVFLTLDTSIGYSIFVAAASTFIVAVIGLIGIPLLSRKPIMPCVHKWASRHVLGLLLIGLPIGVALFNMPLCIDTDPPHSLCIPSNSINRRLLYSFILLVAIYAHTNFSQLGAWPKTIQAIVVAILFLVTTLFCQWNINHILDWNDAARLAKAGELPQEPIKSRNLFAFTPFSEPQVLQNLSYCNRTQPDWASDHYTSPLFVWELFVDVTLAVILVAFLNYQFETAFRMSFFGDVQAKKDTEKMQVVRDHAEWLLNNIIPQHALESLKTNTKYSENHAMTAVLFASITNWNEMYEENFEDGREFLRVLNEIISDFDELLDKPEFNQIEKIKTIGSTYMAASGLNPDKRRLALNPYDHLYQLMEFALALQNALDYFNQDLINFDFIMKIGFNIGPVTAGVIGTTKLYYDIWGDTVNIASRMYSTGVENRIQVSQHTRDLLQDRYDFEYRDHIEVKGVDGGMDTYLLVGRKGEPPLFPENPENSGF